MVWTLGILSCPDDELGRVSEVTARDVGRRVGLNPRHDVQYLKAQLSEAVGYGEDIVIGAGNPNGAILLNEFEFYICGN